MPTNRPTIRTLKWMLINADLQGFTGLAGTIRDTIKERRAKTRASARRLKLERVVRRYD